MEYISKNLLTHWGLTYDKPLNIPAPLNIGDKVALIAPSSPVNPEVLLKSEMSLEFLGLTPITYPSCHCSYGYLAGTDLQRAVDINDSFTDENIKGIFCLRGGYGTPRLLDMLDWSAIAQCPKVFCGFSDITALHIGINKFCGFVTYHSPMPSIDYRRMDDFSLDSLQQAIFGFGSSDAVQNPPDEPIISLYPGIACGQIIGGNLSLLAATLGSPYDIDAKGKILFIEEVGEPLYKIDRSLTALALAGKFEECTGIVLGTFADCTFPENYSLTDMLRDVILPYRKPTILNFRSGHVYPQHTIPMGRMVLLDAQSGTLAFL